MKLLRETIRKIIQEAMIERGYVARRINEIDRKVPEIARMICSGDEQQIYKAKEMATSFMTVIVGHHYQGFHALYTSYDRGGFTIEIITNGYAGEEEILKHFEAAIDQAPHVSMIKGYPKRHKPKSVELEHYPYKHTYRDIIIKLRIIPHLAAK